MSDNSNIETINGTDLLLLIENATADGWQAIAHATAHTLEITRKTRSISSKSTGDVDAVEYGKYTWSGSVDGLVSFSAGIENYNELVNKQLTRQKIKVISIANSPLPTNSTNNPLDADIDTYDPDGLISVNPFIDGSTYHEGSAVITSINRTATDGETVTFSMSFQGASELFPKTVTVSV